MNKYHPTRQHNRFSFWVFKRGIQLKCYKYFCFYNSEYHKSIWCTNECKPRRVIIKMSHFAESNQFRPVILLPVFISISAEIGNVHYNKTSLLTDCSATVCATLTPKYPRLQKKIDITDPTCFKRIEIDNLSMFLSSTFLSLRDDEKTALDWCVTVRNSSWNTEFLIFQIGMQNYSLSLN